MFPSPPTRTTASTKCKHLARVPLVGSSYVCVPHLPSPPFAVILMVYFGLCSNLSSPRTLQSRTLSLPVPPSTMDPGTPVVFLCVQQNHLYERKTPTTPIPISPFCFLWHSIFDGLPSFLLDHWSFPSVYFIDTLPFTCIPRPSSLGYTFVAKQEMI